MTRSNLHRPTELPSLLVRVVRAAEFAAQLDPAGRTGEAEALAHLGHVACLIVPARGVLAPVDDDLCQQISAIATAHLGYGTATRRFRIALDRVQPFRKRDAIDTAHMDIVLATAKAYYYTGLACGLTFTELVRRD